MSSSGSYGGLKVFLVVYQISTNPGSKDLSQILDLNGTNAIVIQSRMTEQCSKNTCVGVIELIYRLCINVNTVVAICCLNFTTFKPAALFFTVALVCMMHIVHAKKTI